MKKSLIFASLLALGSWQTGLADDESLVLNVDFNYEGIKVEKGAASNTAHAVGSNCYVSPDAYGHYLGSSYVNPAENNTDAGNTKNFFYINYDKSDPVGQAFNNSFTFETVFRLNKIDGADWVSANSNWVHNNTLKIIGTQEGGGWSLIQHSTAKSGASLADYKLQGIKPQIAINNDAEASGYTNCNMISYKYLNQGTFYHVVFTYDGPTHKGTIYVNGEKCYDGTLTKDNDGTTELTGTYRNPNCGYGEDGDEATYGVQQMFIILGGDAAGEHTPTACQSPASATFKYVKVYNTVKDADGVAALYDNDVKRYTEPAKPQQLLMDVQFTGGGYDDKSFYSPELPVSQTGTITTQANNTQKRYEMCCTGSNANFLKWTYGDRPTFSKALADEYSIEVYAKGPTGTRDNIICPISGQEVESGPGLQVETNGNVSFKSWARGVSGNSKFSYSQTKANLSNPGAYTEGVYKHYVATFKAGNFLVTNPESKLYIDGALVAYASNAKDKLNGNEHTDFPNANSQWFAIGGDNDATDGTATCEFPWNGEISIARIWSQALSASDIALLNTQAKSPSATITVGSTLYATTCLPFNALVPEGITSYIVTGETSTTATLTSYAKVGQVIPYGVPVILNADAAGDYIFSPALDADMAKPKFNLLKGTLATKAVAEDDAYVMVEQGGRAVLQLSAADLAIPANKAYLNNSSLGGASKAFVINPNPTAINRVDAQDTPDNSYYNLQGQKVEQPSRGIFIQNGKKVFIK